MEKNSLWEKIIKISVGLFFIFLPFERLLTIEVFGLTAKISFALLILIIVLLFFGPLDKKLFLEEKILFCFAALSYISALWSIDFKRSIIISTIYLATFAGFFALRRLIPLLSAEKVKTILIYVGMILAIFALWQYFADLFSLSAVTYLRPMYTKAVFGFPRPQATFLEPLYFANFLFLPIFFSIERAVKKQGGFRNLASLFLMSAVFLLALSRGAYIGLVISLVVFSIIIIYIYKNSWKVIISPLTTIIFGLVAGIALLFLTVPRSNFSTFVRHAGIADVTSEESTVGRFETSKLAWEQAIKYPLGIGAGAFGALPEFDSLYRQGIYQTVGNLYPEILVEEGFAGLILFLFFLFLFARYQWQKIKKRELENLIYFCIFIAIFVQAIAFSSLYILPIWAFLALSWPRTTEKLKN